MTLMENLNKDPGPCSTWVWPQGFSYGGCAPAAPPPPPPPLPLSVRLHTGRAGRGSSHSVPSPRGVCCSILMTKAGEGVRSRYHTLICLRRGGPTMQSAGVRRNSVKADGGRRSGATTPMTKGRNSLTFFCP